MTFTVNGSIWRLKFVSPSNPHLQRSNGTWTIGVTDNNMKTVFIADNLSHDMLNLVICHELCHVFSFENNLSIPIETEEIIAQFMALYGRDIIYLADRILSDIMVRVA